VSGFSQTYTASATAGELLSYSFDTVNNTYSYTITQSAYGLSGRTGSGTLTANADGSYTASESPGSKIYALQNGLLIGRIRIDLGNGLQNVPILGVSNPLTTATEVAGIYNYISFQCRTTSFANWRNCITTYGSISVAVATASTVTYKTCDKANIAAGIAGCLDTTEGTGTHVGGGLWEFLQTGSTSKNYTVANLAPNGQKVGFVDFNDSGGPYGVGQLVISQQAAATAADIAGQYFYKSTAWSTGLTTIFSNLTTADGLTITLNDPWIGMHKTSAAGGQAYGVIWAGVYAYRNPGEFGGYFELGIRKQ